METQVKQWHMVSKNWCKQPQRTVDVWSLRSGAHPTHQVLCTYNSDFRADECGLRQRSMLLLNESNKTSLTIAQQVNQLVSHLSSW